LHQINDENTQIMQFADDFMIISSGKAFNSTVDNLQNKLTDFNLLRKAKGFSFNQRKSVVINVGRGCKNVVNIAVENVAVPNQKRVTFLGRIISENMSHKEHAKKIKADTKISSRILHYATKIKSGLKPKVSTNLSKSFVRSKQEYAITSIADMGCGANKSLEIAQAGALRRFVGVPPGTCKHEIFVLVVVMPPIFILTVKEFLK